LNGAYRPPPAHVGAGLDRIVSNRAATIRPIAEALASPAPATQHAPPAAGGDICGSPSTRETT
jgi:hypothetical protein